MCARAGRYQNDTRWGIVQHLYKCLNGLRHIKVLYIE